MNVRQNDDFVRYTFDKNGSILAILWLFQCLMLEILFVYIK